EVSAKGMTPGHEPTIQDAVLRAPTRVDVEPYIPKAAFREPEPVSEPAAPAVTAPEHTPSDREPKSGPKPIPPMLDVPWVDPVSGQQAIPLSVVASDVVTPVMGAPAVVAVVAPEPKPLPLVMVAAELSPPPTAPEVTP